MENNQITYLKGLIAFNNRILDFADSLKDESEKALYYSIVDRNLMEMYEVHYQSIQETPLAELLDTLFARLCEPYGILPPSYSTMLDYDCLLSSISRHLTMVEDTGCELPAISLVSRTKYLKVRAVTQYGERTFLIMSSYPNDTLRIKTGEYYVDELISYHASTYLGTILKDSVAIVEKTWCRIIRDTNLEYNTNSIEQYLEDALPNRTLFGKVVKIQTVNAIGGAVLPQSVSGKRIKVARPTSAETSGRYIKRSLDNTGECVFYYPKDDATSVYRYLNNKISEIGKSKKLVRIPTLYVSLYRTDTRRSKIFNILKQALRLKFKVYVLIELRARFDEAQNLSIAKKLTALGANVAFSKDAKVHAKCITLDYEYKDSMRGGLSVISTGNFNSTTNKLYKDITILTTCSREAIKIESLFAQFFDLPDNNLLSRMFKYEKDSVLSTVLDNIQKESHPEGNIFIKVNTLTLEEVIAPLLAAADAGCKITLSVRGACIVPPHKNITVYHEYGTLLEHARVYAFGDKVYISSADLMPRNMKSRYEYMYKVESVEAKEKILANTLHTKVKTGRHLWRSFEEKPE